MNGEGNKMKVDIRKNFKEAIRYKIIDMNTNQEIKNAICADDEIGEYVIEYSESTDNCFKIKSDELI